MANVDFRPFAERTPAACSRCAGTAFIRVSQWRGQAVEGGAALGLRVRCGGCGAEWASRIALHALAADEPLVWSLCGPSDAEPGAAADTGRT